MYILSLCLSEKEEKTLRMIGLPPPPFCAISPPPFPFIVPIVVNTCLRVIAMFLLSNPLRCSANRWRFSLNDLITGKYLDFGYKKWGS